MINKVIAALLFVIATSLVFISWQIYKAPTFGEIIKIRKIENPEERKAAFDNFVNRLPISKVHSVMGTVDVNVENTVDVNIER